MDITPTPMNVEEEPNTSTGESTRLSLHPVSENCLGDSNSKNSNSNSRNKFESWRNHSWNSEGLDSESPIEDSVLDQDVRSITQPWPQKLVVSRRVPYKDITNDKEYQPSQAGDIGQTRPAQSSTTFVGTNQVLESTPTTPTPL